MSAYKLIEVLKTEERETQSIYDKESLDQAVVAMHNDFGVAVKQESTIGAYAVVIDNATGARADGVKWGEDVKSRVYTHNDYAEDNISSYDSDQLAVGNYHTKLASQRNNSNCNFAITIRFNGKGEYADVNVWNRNTPVVDGE